MQCWRALRMDIPTRQINSSPACTTGDCIPFGGLLSKTLYICCKGSLELLSLQTIAPYLPGFPMVVWYRTTLTRGCDQEQRPVRSVGGGSVINWDLRSYPFTIAGCTSGALTGFWNLGFHYFSPQFASFPALRSISTMPSHSRYRYPNCLPGRCSEGSMPSICMAALPTVSHGTLSSQIMFLPDLQVRRYLTAKDATVFST
ncbi:hypothetical protein BKA82DRAFT_336488 [Pisolithus tinctorius]|nr:hypothetical protein BKA82DRAFT_336488 [Pisolithus tinctorius]